MRKEKNCIWCNKPTERSDKLCSRKCKEKNSKSLQDATDVYCPIIVTKDLSVDDKRMQNAWVKKNSVKAKERSLKIIG